jgi:hypothetical protein
MGSFSGSRDAGSSTRPGVALVFILTDLMLSILAAWGSMPGDNVLMDGTGLIFIAVNPYKKASLALVT